MEKLIDSLSQAINDGDADVTKTLVEDALGRGMNPLELIDNCITKALKMVGDKFEKGEIFLLDLMAAATAVVKAMEVLKPALEKSGEKPEYVGKIVLGTVEGDIHDIGKNIVGSILLANGFEVIDIGADASISKFVEKVKEVKSEFVGASALLTTTLPKQKDLVDALEKEGLRNSVKVLVGGSPCTPEWAKEIGADGYAADGVQAVKIAKSMIGK